MNIDTWVGAGIVAAVMGMMAWFMGEAIRLLINKAVKKQPGKPDKTGVVFLGQLARVGVWLAAIHSYASLVPAVKELLDPHTFVGAAIYAFIVGAAAWLIGRALRLAVHRVLEKRGESVDQTAVRFLGQLARVGVWIFAFIAYAHLIPALQRFGTTWLASAGVVAVVVGMAAQNTLGNLIAGVSLVLYRPFHLGDELQVSTPGGLETGVVENISLGYTLLRTGDERRLVIPNNLIANQTIINRSMSTQPVPFELVLTLEHDADLDKARQILLEVARQQPKALGTPTCRLTNLSGAGLTVTLTAWAARPQAVPDMKCDLLEGAKKQLDLACIKLHRDYPVIARSS
ncbi:MAG: mechanosensitive ion channel domain-containing protein [Verrucomicrobiota bacterium]